MGVFDLKWEPGEEREFADRSVQPRRRDPRCPLLALPTTVTFGNVADPKSVALVDPRNLSATFGPGYELKSATIQITDEPVTRGIEKVLPWMEDNKAAPLGNTQTVKSRNSIASSLQREFQTYGDGR